MSLYNLAVIITNPNNDDEFLIVKQNPPPKFADDEYDSYVDSPLWDLPSVQLSPIQNDNEDIELERVQLCSDEVDLTKFDLTFALNQVSEQIGIRGLIEVRWRFLKYIEGADFGPGPLIHTVFITGKCSISNESKTEAYQWTSQPRCVEWVLDTMQDSNRMGPIVTSGLLHDHGSFVKKDIPNKLPYQEYPLGVMLFPMGSRTAKPFRTTNLVVIAPDMVLNSQSDQGCVAHGDALIVDPGCSSRFHHELSEIVAALPRKLIVFVTHHHHDHIDGLSVIQKSNPDSVLLAHANTMRRIGKGDWSLGYTAVSGDEEICVGGQRLRVIFAPGHTDGHMALLHINTKALIVGDHCVGQGSAALDVCAGGNMADYFRTTYKFLDLSPNALIPMHGKVNLWPQHMLCGYLKNRREREISVLKAIQSGKTTLFDLVATIYKDVHRTLWIPASSNVTLHVEHLVHQHKLPEEFWRKFKGTCGLHFMINWTWAYVRQLISRL